MPDLQKAVLDAMERQKVSSYSLVQMLKGKRPKGKDVPPATVYDFLRGDTPINSRDLGLILDVLGLELKPRAKR